MPIERAVYAHRRDWRLVRDRRGHAEEGRRADLAVIDPRHLDASLDEKHEEPIPELGGYVRLVRRNPQAVPAVVVNGTLVALAGEVLPEIGKTTGTGRFLRARASAP